MSSIAPLRPTPSTMPPSDLPPPTIPGSAIPLDRVPRLPPEAFRSACLGQCTSGSRVSALFAATADTEQPELIAVLTNDGDGDLTLLRAPILDAAFPSLTSRLPQAQAFEREIYEEHRFEPEGHPWLKPLRRHAELDATQLPHPFFRVEGPGIHEVAVGPVHAGVIEPGHFRFQCRGEDVLSLEIQLGFQTRGAEALMLKAAASPARRLAVAETVAGDTSIGHGLAYCGALEALTGAQVPPRAEALRAVALELERCANHVGDLGALCNDVGYLPASAYFGRLRGEFLNLTLELCGNRFGRGLLVPGGVRFDADAARANAMLARLAVAERDCRTTAEMMFDSASVVARFEGTGQLTREMSDELGLVGPVARACGSPRDVRIDHPWGAYGPNRPQLALAQTGDVMARARVRWMEVERSIAFIQQLLGALPAGPLRAEVPAALRPDAVATSLIEGWRGEIAHVAMTGPDGTLRAYKIVDPSFHNWFGLAMALRGNPISDFPLCNKSFNLSYCGHDL